jgi:hypothetical protein
MTEIELLYAVTWGSRKRPGLCRRLGVRYFHPYDSRRSVPGWPDVVFVGTRAICFRELKDEWGEVRPEQADWGRALRAAGQDWAVWRPSDLASGRIEAELAALMTG